MDDVFDIENFNIIQDEENYYFFRALNMADNADIDNGVTADENGDIERIRTDRERWEETHFERAPRYDENSELTLEQINDHIKMRYSKETNCISLSSNANVSVVYGRGSYTDKYIMVKVPKSEMGKNIVHAGQYMLREIEKRVNEAINSLDKTENASLIQTIEQIKNVTTLDEISDIILKLQTLNTTNQMNYIGTKLKDRADAVPARMRFSSYQSLDEQQTLEKNKIIAILTLLERKGIMKPIIPNSTSNSKLARTIGNAFSSSELIHYGDIQNSQITQVSKDIMDMFALLQQAKEKVPKQAQKIEDIERKLLQYAYYGYELQNRAGELVFSNDQDTIHFDEIAQRLLTLQENEFHQISIEEMYNITEGKIDYKSALQMQKMLFYISKAKGKAIAFSNILNEITENNPQYQDAIKSIAKHTFGIEPEITTRQNEKGYKLSEAVGIDAKKDENGIIEYIQNCSTDKLIEMVETRAQAISTDIIRKNFSNIVYDKPIDKETYYIKAVVDSYNWEKTGIIFRQEERANLEKRLKNKDLIQLYEKLKELQIPEEIISRIILNLGMKEKFSNILNAENFNELVQKHIEELTRSISIDQVETFLGYYDIPGTDIGLREYQQRAVNKANKLFEEKQFASVILPTGAGKSFVAMAELISHKDEQMLYLAPSDEILNQIKKYIIKYIHGTKGTIGKSEDEIIKEVFPNLKLATYQSLLHKKAEELQNSKYDFVILDELHRTGAEKWQKKLEILLEAQEEKTKVLGITATPERDSDGRNMADELALKIGSKYNKAYTEEEVKNGKHIAMKMDLIEAIRLGIVVNPKLVSCEYNITQGNTLEKLLERINNIEDEEKKSELLQKYEKLRASLKDAQGIPELLKQNIKKKDGRYIVFIPVSENGEDLEDEHGNKSSKKSAEEKIKDAEMQLREWLQGVEETKYDEQGNIIDGPEIYSMLGQYSAKRNAKELNGFETSDSNHIKLMIVMNKLNEGVHVRGVNGIIWTRALDENSRILLLQQLGRVVYGIDLENPVKDEDRPLVIDLPNNMLNVDLEKIVNTYTKRDDIELLTEMVEWVQVHNGYIPDINSTSNEESRRAITLKRIQRKYEKYLQNAEEQYKILDEEEIEEIRSILDLGSQIDLWEIEFPDKIGKDGKKLEESELEKVNFSIEGKLRDVYELQEEIEEEEGKGGVQKFIEKLQKLQDLGVDISKMTQRDTIETLSKKSGVCIEILKIEGVDIEDKIGITRTNIIQAYRGKGASTPPTKEQVEKLKNIGITLDKQERNVTQEFIEKLEKIQSLGVDISKIKNRDTIGTLAKKSGVDIETLKNSGLNIEDGIGLIKSRIAQAYRGNGRGTPPTKEQVEKLKNIGITLDKQEKDVTQEFIEKLEKIQSLGVDVSKIKCRDTIGTLAEKSGMNRETLRSSGLNIEDGIGLIKSRIAQAYRGNGRCTPPTKKQVEKLKSLGISLDERDTTQEFIDKLQELQSLGVDISKMKTSDTIETLAKKSGVDIETLKNSELNIEDKIGEKKNKIALAYRGKGTNKPPTEEQVETLKSLGISLEKKLKSSKELAEATISAIKNPDLLDSEQQALDALVAQTKEKGGQDGQEQS